LVFSDLERFLYPRYDRIIVEEAILMRKSRPIREQLADGQVYEYIPLGKHIVSAPGVCRGRPTFNADFRGPYFTLNRVPPG
jgi:hypothetical protein